MAFISQTYRPRKREKRAIPPLKKKKNWGIQWHLIDRILLPCDVLRSTTYVHIKQLLF